LCFVYRGAAALLRRALRCAPAAAFAAPASCAAVFGALLSTSWLDGKPFYSSIKLVGDCHLLLQR
jgi:hypothetical protein